MKVIGQGVNACVVKPPYECKTKDVGQNMIGKITSVTKVNREDKIYNLITQIDPKHIFSPKDAFSCVPTVNTYQIKNDMTKMNCDSVSNTKEDLHQLVMSDHGKSFNSVNSNTLKRIVKDPYKYLSNETKRLLFAGYVLRKNKLSHMDLHYGNVLVDPKDGHLTIIDFGELTKDNDIRSYITKRVFTKRDYVQFPPELFFIWGILLGEKRRETLYRLQHLPEQIIRLLKMGSKTGRMGGETVKLMRMYPELKSVYEILDPTNYHAQSRENLYEIRCESLLSIIGLLKNGKKFEYIMALSFVSIDSYAIGRIIRSLLQKVMFIDTTIAETTLFKKITNIANKMASEDIRKRISARQALLLIE